MPTTRTTRSGTDASGSEPASGGGVILKPESTTEKVLERDSVSARLPLLGKVALPPPQHLAWYAGVAFWRWRW